LRILLEEATNKEGSEKALTAEGIYFWLPLPAIARQIDVLCEFHVSLAAQELSLALRPSLRILRI